MTQSNPIIGSDKSGLQYRTEDNDGKRALLNHNKGSIAPTYAEAGTIWVDDSATPWLMKMHDGTDWVIIGEVNATTNQFAPYSNGALLADASEDIKGLVERASDAEVSAGTDTTRYITPKQLADNGGGGKVLGQVYIKTGAVFTTTSIIPYDDTIPQNTEGAELMVLSYTPQSATSNIIIEAGIISDHSANNTTTLAVFKDAFIDALAASNNWAAGGVSHNVNMLYEEVSGDTTTRVYKVRIGVAVSNTLTINGRGGSRRMGGVSQTYMKITEIEV